MPQMRSPAPPPFLKEMGYENMKDSYYALNDGICVVNFAQMEGGCNLLYRFDQGWRCSG